jgi:hypothetical protein
VLVFGEPLAVRYEYAHDLGPDVRHRGTDWIGLFRVLPRPTQAGLARVSSSPRSTSQSSSPTRNRGHRADLTAPEDPYIDFPHSLRNQSAALIEQKKKSAARARSVGSAAGGSRTGRRGPGPGAREAAHSGARRLGSLAGTRPTDPEHEEMVNTLCAENVSPLVDPTRFTSLNAHVLFDPPTAAHPPLISTHGKTGRRAAALHAAARTAISGAGATVGTVATAKADETLAAAGYTEVLESFFLVSDTSCNSGIATFPAGFPTRLGTYRIRYFLQVREAWVVVVVCALVKGVGRLKTFP